MLLSNSGWLAMVYRMTLMEESTKTLEILLSSPTCSNLNSVNRQSLCFDHRQSIDASKQLADWLWWNGALPKACLWAKSKTSKTLWLFTKCSILTCQTHVKHWERTTVALSKPCYCAFWLTGSKCVWEIVVGTQRTNTTGQLAAASIISTTREQANSDNSGPAPHNMLANHWVNKQEHPNGVVFFICD